MWRQQRRNHNSFRLYISLRGIVFITTQTCKGLLNHAVSGYRLFALKASLKFYRSEHRCYLSLCATQLCECESCFFGRKGCSFSPVLCTL